MTRPHTLYIHGTGGHGRVVADAALRCWPSLALVGTDDNAINHGKPWLGEQRTQAPALALDSGAAMHIAVGHNAARAALAKRFGLLQANAPWLQIVHPQASVSAWSDIGAGSLVAAQAVVGPQSRVGKGVIVNHAAVIDHDAVIGDFCHIAPGAVLGGSVQVGARVLVGARAVVLPGMTICDDAVIGAGAVVTRPIDAPGTWVGMPARRVKP